MNNVFLDIQVADEIMSIIDIIKLNVRMCLSVKRREINIVPRLVIVHKEEKEEYSILVFISIGILEANVLIIMM